jgi:hypothetical protein
MGTMRIPMSNETATAKTRIIAGVTGGTFWNPIEGLKNLKKQRIKFTAKAFPATTQNNFPSPFPWLGRWATTIPTHHLVLLSDIQLSTTARIAVPTVCLFLK